jgi:protein-tyrosine phosphatase
MRNLSIKLNWVLLTAGIALGPQALADPVSSNETDPERVIWLEGTSNTRDIGGYLTEDLRTVRWRQIIRSENLSRLTHGDFQELEAIGVKTVIDLRTEREQKKSPTRWQGENPPRFYHFPMGDADLEWFKHQRRLMKRNWFTEGQSLAHMVEGYRVLSEVGAPSLQNLMEVVLEPSNWPILIHCQAGKDRSGIAVALILDAIGVDRDIIMEDYLLTNEIIRAEEKSTSLAEKSKVASYRSHNGWSPSARAWFPFVGVHAEMLAAFYESIDEAYGSMDAFLDEIGVDPAARAGLVSALTTEPPDGTIGN